MPRTYDSNGLQVKLVPILIRFTRGQKIQLEGLAKKTGKSVNHIVRGMVKRELEIREEIMT